jgi:hypothetical protein
MLAPRQGFWWGSRNKRTGGTCRTRAPPANIAPSLMCVNLVVSQRPATPALPHPNEMQRLFPVVAAAAAAAVLPSGAAAGGSLRAAAAPPPTPGECGNTTLPLSPSSKNVLIIGDSISMVRLWIPAWQAAGHRAADGSSRPVWIPAPWQAAGHRSADGSSWDGSPVTTTKHPPLNPPPAPAFFSFCSKGSPLHPRGVWGSGSVAPFSEGRRGAARGRVVQRRAVQQHRQGPNLHAVLPQLHREVRRRVVQLRPS